MGRGCCGPAWAVLLLVLGPGVGCVPDDDDSSSDDDDSAIGGDDDDSAPWVPSPEGSFVERELGVEFPPTTSDLMGQAGIVSADWDGDGHDDLVHYTLGGLTLFRSLGGGEFEAAVALESAERASSAGFVDLDNDGALELVSSAGNTIQVHRWLDGEPALVYAKHRITLDSGIQSLGAGDIDGDGFVDIAATGTSFSELNRPTFFMNVGDGTLDLVDSSFDIGIDDLWKAYFTVIDDVDSDGDADVFIGHETSFSTPPVDVVRAFAFFRQDRDEAPPFAQEVLPLPDYADWVIDLEETFQFSSPMGMAVGDPDGSGIWRAFVVGGTGAFMWTYDPDDGFVEEGNDWGVNFWTEPGWFKETRWGWGPVFVDFDLDGRMDIIHGSTRRPFQEWQDGQMFAYWHLPDGRRYDDRSGDFFGDVIGEFYSTNIADVDEDGRPDLLVGGLSEQTTRVFLNDVVATNPSLRVDLLGGPSGRDAPGTRVAVFGAGGAVQRQVGSFQGASSALQNPRVLWFGVAEPTEACVDWPSGVRSCESVLPGVERVLVQEPDWFEMSARTTTPSGDAITITLRPVDDRGDLLGAGHEVTIEATEGTVSAINDGGDGSYQATWQPPASAGIVRLSMALDGDAFALRPRITVGD
jgi:enediyne biosynthesis protein E4